MVNSLANEYTKDERKIVAYRAGKAITKEDLYLELKKSEKEIEEGDYLTIEDLQKSLKNGIEKSKGRNFLLKHLMYTKFENQFCNSVLNRLCFIVRHPV